MYFPNNDKNLKTAIELKILINIETSFLNCQSRPTMYNIIIIRFFRSIVESLNWESRENRHK